ncbi:MAG: alanine:cation symporter family protein, partial [Bacteroidales bacterium]|nr:alanine:cation symporter family protein [Bacteroidales bacterium]
ITTHYENIIPSFLSIFSDAFTGSAAVGGFLGAGFAFTFNKGVNRGLFSNEAGQGSAPIAHSAARAHEPVSEGMVAILEPFIDTIIICSLTGLVLLASGAWNEKIYNRFEQADLQIVQTIVTDDSEEDTKILRDHVFGKNPLPLFEGELEVVEGKIQNNVSLIHARSLAENVEIRFNQKPYTGKVVVYQGKPDRAVQQVEFWGSSLIHSASLTTEAFKRSFLGNFGQYIVSIGLLLFAFSTAISWSYYGDRAVTYLFGTRWVMAYRLIYVIAFFFAAFTDTTIVWNLSYITIAVMTIPNLLGLWILRRDIKSTINQYWVDFASDWPGAKLPKKFTDKH